MPDSEALHSEATRGMAFECSRVAPMQAKPREPRAIGE
jgi:hypothetical protein